MLLRNSICFRYAQTRYMLISFAFDMLPLATSVDCAFSLIAPQGISSALALYRVADISSDASAAHIDVEPTCETNDGLDMGQDSKRYKNRSKTGVETPKGICYRGGKYCLSLIFSSAWKHINLFGQVLLGNSPRTFYMFLHIS